MPGGAQALLLALCSEMTPGGVLGTICGARVELGRSLQGRCLTPPLSILKNGLVFLSLGTMLLLLFGGVEECKQLCSRLAVGRGQDTRGVWHQTRVVLCTAGSLPAVCTVSPPSSVPLYSVTSKYVFFSFLFVLSLCLWVFYCAVFCLFLFLCFVVCAEGQAYSLTYLRLVLHCWVTSLAQ